jgi:hypothetical protein
MSNLESRVQDLGFKGWELGLLCFGFRIYGLGCKVQGLAKGFRVQGLWFVV